MHTLDSNTDPHITHQTPSCIALHPHAIQTPIFTDDVHTTPITLCICPTKHTGISTIESYDTIEAPTSISGLKITGPPPEPLTPPSTTLLSNIAHSGIDSLTVPHGQYSIHTICANRSQHPTLRFDFIAYS